MKWKLREHQGLVSARFEWEMYCRFHRPTLELWREWCGYAAIKEFERASANEAERVRLFSLADRLIDHIEKTEPQLGAEYRKELLFEEITPCKVRESPDRPLSPDEIPVRLEYRRRLWRR